MSEIYLHLLIKTSGAFILPLLPVVMENCAECTYPVPEETSMGILFVGANYVGLGMIFMLQVSRETLFHDSS